MSWSLTPADLQWQDGPVIRSGRFNDIYFSPADGLAETRHVFIDGNRLPDRFRNSLSGSAQPFVIAELGFGTGLNLLAAWHCWQALAPPGKLHFFSIEGFPLRREDFGRIHKRLSEQWPELANLSRRLVERYPPLTPGYHTVQLAADVTLTLAFDEVSHALDQAHFAADAWFLDGFSPAENPSMWAEPVLGRIAELSAPGATAATFTVAGAVRRGLAAAGFAIEKAPGFGRKRDMLRARITTLPVRRDDKPWFSPPARPTLMPADAPATEGRRVFIAGAGIAGASAAFHLGQAGFAVTICDPAGPASGASGNPAGLVLPRLDLDESPAAHFYRQAWLYTTALIVELEAGADEPILRSEGGLLLAKTAQDADRHRRLAETFKGAPELVTRSGPVAGGFAECAASPDAHLLVQRGGTIDPAAFVRALLQGTRIINAPFTGFATKENSIEVTLAGQDGPVIHETDYLVIATALAAREHLPGHGLAGSLGQVDVIDAAPPPRAVTFGNYAAPLGAHTITGATYENYDELKPAAPSPERTRQNIAALRAMAPHVPATSDIISSRTAIRAVTPDRHPVAGPMPDPAHIQAAYAGLRQGRREEYPTARYLPGVYILTGLGSRGLTTAPYCAAIVSAEISGAPSPAQRDILDLVHPARFMIRDLKRRKAGTGP